MDLNKQLVSIIVPFLNSADTLQRCVDSIIAQDYTNWELLLVDNGSSDDYENVINPYICTDNRIKLLKCPQKGVSNARNMGLDNAMGEFVCFVDSDDYVETNYLSNFINHCENDLVVCGFIVEKYDNHLILKASDYHIPEDISTNINNIIKLKETFKAGYMHICCNKLYQNSIIKKHSIKFKNIPINEDYLFALEYISYCDSLRIIPNASYHWIRVANKLTGVMSIPESIIKIYNESHIKLKSLLKNEQIANEIAYLSYNIIVFKILNLLRAKIICRNFAFKILHEFHTNTLINESYKSYKPITRGERLFYSLQKYGLFKIHYYLLKII